MGRAGFDLVRDGQGALKLGDKWTEPGGLIRGLRPDTDFFLFVTYLDKDGKAGPLADIKALPYVFVVKVKLPAQSEEVSATPGLNADGSVATAAPAPVAPLAAGPDAATPAAPAAGQPKCRLRVPFSAREARPT